MTSVATLAADRPNIGRSIWAVVAGFLVIIGLVLSMGGVYASTQQHMGPLWYPIFLAISSPITAWIGGTLFVRNSAGART